MLCFAHQTGSQEDFTGGVDFSDEQGESAVRDGSFCEAKQRAYEQPSAEQCRRQLGDGSAIYCMAVRDVCLSFNG